MTNSVNMTRNRELNVMVNLGVRHQRPRTMISNWLINPHMTQAEADFAVKVVETCAQVSGTDLGKPGNWDALAHCMTVTLLLVSTEWFLNYSGYMHNQQPQSVEQMVQDVFGDKYVGNPIVAEFDSQGNAVKTIPSVV